MPTITVNEGQTLLDIALQGTGDLTRVFEVAALNGVDITDDLPIGGMIQSPDPAVDKSYLVDLFAVVYQKPKSADNEVARTNGREGIGFWAIAVDFIVQPDNSE